MLVVVLRVLAILFGHVLESNPALSVLNIFKLLTNFLLGVASRLDGSPEGDEFVETDLAVVVHVHRVEELDGRDAPKGTLPVLQGFFLVDRLAVVQVEAVERLKNLLLRLRGQLIRGLCPHQSATSHSRYLQPSLLLACCP